MVVVLVTDRFKASLVFVGTVLIFMIGGVLEVSDFTRGFSNLSILTIFLLIIITAALNEHFNLATLFDRFLGKAGNGTSFLFRMSTMVSGISAFMNNTPVVAMMMPYVYQWGKENKVSPSKLLIPLSYSAIVGGMITLIGTSTNLVLNGLLASEGQALLTFTDFLVPGLLVTFGSIVFISLVSPLILKGRKDFLDVLKENTREYLVETEVLETSDMIGFTVEQAGLRNLDGVFLAELVRGAQHFTPVSPTQVIKAGDILMFAGETTLIFKLLKRDNGLELSKKSQFKMDSNGHHIAEAIVAQNSPLDRRTVKEVGFREKYDAAIIGIHRKGEKVSGKIGHIALRTGDLLLLMSGPGFKERNHQQQDLIVVNTLEENKELTISQKRTFWAGALLSLGLIIGGVLSLFEGLLAILFVQFIAGMLNLDTLKKHLSLDLFLILTGALAIGQALIHSGAAKYLMDTSFQGAANWSPFTLVVVVFFMTFILTSVISNVAAISIIFPIILGLTATASVPATALFLTAAFAASCCFVTPFAYQTNLMVMEAGNYRFSDYLRLGLPLSLLYASIFLGYIVLQYDLL